MTKFRARKQQLETALLPPHWPEDAAVPAAIAAIGGMEAVSPLLALLPRGGLLGWRSVIVLGRVVADLARTDMEDARTVMRRCMWHMNEDSGNMGWGVAEAMGEILALSPALAGEYGRVVLSYVRDTGFADNFVDHAALRRGAYWAVGRFAPRYVRYHAEACELLVTGLEDEDGPCRGMAVWGLGRLALVDYPPGGKERVTLAARVRAMRPCADCCEILEGVRISTSSVSSFADQALARIESRAAPESFSG